MAIQVARYSLEGKIGWAVHVRGGLTPLAGHYPTTRDFIEQGGIAAACRLEPAPSLHIEQVELLPPVTSDGDYICQATNYAGHLKEIGRNPADVLANVIFTKASSCICGPNATIERPGHVRLLDYEIELGLVLGRTIDGPVTVTEANLHEFVAGWVITNDITARDVQVSHEQFHKSKSYRTFGPTGPFLVLPAPQDANRWRDLRLQLRVNGELRQNASASDMIFGPCATLTELSQIRDMKAGDMIATGTPAGVAIKVPSKFKVAVAGFLPPPKRFAAFLKAQAGVEAYLKDGDLIEASIGDPSGRFDLGLQRNRVVSRAS
jgi:2-keto-4-pentenoate hydratase/2-oxohepta-3-ene-1,7-dioic acid hydratase in catechol pathway